MKRSGAPATGLSPREWISLVATGNHWASQAVRFAFVGVLNTAVTGGVIFTVYWMFQSNYYLANAIGFLAGFLNSFVWNKYWTFRSSGNPMAELVLFSFVALFAYVVQLLSLWILWHVLSLPLLLSQVIAMGAYTTTGFLSNRTMTFSRGRSHAC